MSTAIVLEVHNCANRHSYKVTFATDDQAADFVLARSSTHAFHEWVEGSVASSDAPRTFDLLWPICEHSLSGHLCSGPNHYAEPGGPGWD